LLQKHTERTHFLKLLQNYIEQTILKPRVPAFFEAQIWFQNAFAGPSAARLSQHVFARNSRRRIYIYIYNQAFISIGNSTRIHNSSLPAAPRNASPETQKAAAAGGYCEAAGWMLAERFRK
jgi:hypothetical protein